ncbi:MAG: cytochrome c biogenesis protein ResB [Anaerolineae bacterium]
MVTSTAKTFNSKLKTQSVIFINTLWYTLRSLQLTGVLIGIIALVSFLSLVIPQQSASPGAVPTREVWIADLPATFRSLGEALFFLGFANILQSVWFWLPLALLLLNSLIALADYLPGSWQRLQTTLPSLDRQHPLAKRAEQITRLPESPDEYLDTLKRKLQQKGFFLYQDGQTEERMIGAVQHRWTWLAPAGWYAGIILLIAAFLVSYFFLQVDKFTLSPQETKSSILLAGTVELEEVNSEQGLSSIKYTAGEQVLQLRWRLYQPALLHQTLIMPVALEPVLTIEATDSQGKLVRLIPSQENLPPAERLHLSLADTQSPQYFLIPVTGLAFQILPSSDSSDELNIQVRRAAETIPSTEIKTKVGEAFKVDELTVLITRNHNLTVLARRDPALPLYLIGLVVVLTACILYFWRPPLQLWLIPEVKGRGGQLYGVVEKFGTAIPATSFLDELWTSNQSSSM